MPAVYDGGTLSEAYEKNFPVLAGQRGSVCLVRLDPGGVREPHWCGQVRFGVCEDFLLGHAADVLGRFASPEPAR
ncbi:MULTISPECIES: cupin domain-containing protein [Actinomycetes]|uniref:cupin domain-containing protein n=1 Tax=Actinomycetes TaxID=1760 RepID=UPI0001DEE38F|nr:MULTISPECIES: cupin domain-containing protein [Actinomycetes]EFL06475.1 predicted protein [Streptomyces sp. AA4]